MRGRVPGRGVAVAEAAVLPGAPRPGAAARRAAQEVPPRRVARHLDYSLTLQTWGDN